MVRFRKAVAAALATGLLVSASMRFTRLVNAAELPIIDRSHEVLNEAQASVGWTRRTPVWEVWNQSSGAAYAKHGERNIIEAMSVCQAPLAFHQAAAKLVYRFGSGYTGMAMIRAEGSIMGQAISYPATGWGDGEARVTLDVKDLDTGDLEVSEVVHKEAAPSAVERLFLRQTSVENRATKTELGYWYSLWLQRGHTYEATVKLWTECKTKGFYAVRTDYSRHTLSTREDPLIGMVRVDRLIFRIPQPEVDG